MSTNLATSAVPPPARLPGLAADPAAQAGSLEEQGIDRAAAIRLLEMPPDASDPETARLAWPAIYDQVADRKQDIARAAELDGVAPLVCIDRLDLAGPQLATLVVRRYLAGQAARHGLPATGEQWGFLRYGYRLASVNTARLAGSSRAIDGAIVVDDEHLTQRGEISAAALTSIRLTDGPLALWRGVIRTREGTTVRDLDWLTGEQLAEPCLRFDWFLDPLVELVYLTTHTGSKSTAVRGARQTIQLRGVPTRNVEHLVRLAERIPGALRQEPDVSERTSGYVLAELAVGLLADKGSTGETWWDAQVKALGNAMHSGPPPLLYACLTRGRAPQLELAQSSAVCGDVLLAGDRASTRPVSPAQLANLFHGGLSRRGVVAIDPEQRDVVEDLIDRARRTLAVTSVPGLPGRGQLLVGQSVGTPIRLEEVSVPVAMDLVRHHEEQGRRPVIDAEVGDVVRMLTAPVRDSGRTPNGEQLFGFQRRLVAQIEATCLGAVLASGTGTGKSPMAVECLNRWAGMLPAFRALIIVEDELVAQWLDDVLVGLPGEPAFLTPDALVRVVDRTSSVARAMAELDRDAGQRPAVALCDRTTARVAVRALSRTARRDGTGELICFWDALLIDESDFLSGQSATARAVRDIRGNADRALLITATPIRAAPQELVEQVAIARAQSREVARRARRRMRAMRLTSEDTSRVHEAYSVVVARPTPEEVEDVMPRLGEVLVQQIPPTELERRVLLKVEDRLVATYRRLAEAAEAAGKLDPETDEGRENLVALEQARRSLNRIGPLAIRLACDWQAALQTSSDLGQLLAIDEDLRLLAASKQTPTMRRLNGEIIASSVAAGAPILAFCENVAPLRLLRDELRVRHGVEAGLLTGETPAAERHAMCRAFREGADGLDALLVGPKSIRGKNLQRARRVLHIDLPAGPYRYEQRNGRAARIGSMWPEIDVVIPELEGSYQRFMRELIVTRAATVSAILDGTGSRSHMASQFAGLASDLQLGETATAIGYVAARLLELRG